MGTLVGPVQAIYEAIIRFSIVDIFETQLEFERMLITESSRLPDFAEGVAAFLEKRDPIFHSSHESE